MGKGTTFSDSELTRWGEIRSAAGAEEYDWMHHGASAPTIAVALSRELLAARSILRELVLRQPVGVISDPLVLRAIDLLGMNLYP